MTGTMRRGLGVACILAIMLAISTGCATPRMQMAYHHHNAETEVFWMTSVTKNPDRDDKLTLWRCTHYADGPACVQAKLVSCPRGAHLCEFSVDDVIFPFVLDPSGSGKKTLMGM